MIDPIEAAEAAQKVADAIQGTDLTVYQVLGDLELDENLENDNEFIDHLDTLVFCCSVCLEWFDFSEIGKNVKNKTACFECGGVD